MYALNLAENGRILSVCFWNEFLPSTMPVVEYFPGGETGSVTDYLFIDGQYVYDPIPAPPEPIPEPSAEEIINALLGGE